jgi:thymidine kinase
MFLLCSYSVFFFFGLTSHCVVKRTTKEMFGGELHLIIGPMFSGKTSELLRYIRRHQIASQQTLLIRYTLDSRYTTESRVVSHELQSLPAVSATHLLQFTPMFHGETPEGYDRCEWEQLVAIGIDEGQFYPDLAEFVAVALRCGKLVYCAALDADYRAQPFQSVCLLVAQALTVTKLSAVCFRCKQMNALFSHRLSSSETKKTIQIGGQESYQACCRECFDTLN